MAESFAKGGKRLPDIGKRQWQTGDIYYRGIT
jgi:hypothetical protein